MDDKPYFYTDRDRVTFNDVELVITGVVSTKWPPGTWSTPADEEIPLYGILHQAMADCGLGEKADDVYKRLRALAEPLFAKVVNGHEEIRLDVVKRFGQW